MSSDLLGTANLAAGTVKSANMRDFPSSRIGQNKVRGNRIVFMRSFLFRFSICVIAMAGFNSSAGAAPEVGDRAPRFSLTGSDGETYSSADFKGKQAMVIAWYPKAFTGG